MRHQDPEAPAPATDGAVSPGTAATPPGPLPPVGNPEIGLPGWPPALVDRIANAIYVGLVNPDLTWWDDLDPEMQAAYRRAALHVVREITTRP